MESIKAILFALTLLSFGRVDAADDAHKGVTGYINIQSVASQNEAHHEASAQNKDSETQTVTVSLTDKGYEPQSLKLKKDIPAKVTFVRKSKTTCGTEIVIPEYSIKRELPLNEAVVVEFTPTKTGEFEFVCGMGMLRGKIVVLQAD